MKYEYQKKDTKLSFSGAVNKLRAKHDVKIVRYINHQHPARTECIKEKLEKNGIPVNRIKISKNEYNDYIKRASYNEEYYSDNIIEKRLEHFICYKLLKLSDKDVFVDIASEHSPLCEIMQRLTGCKGFMQDIMYPSGIHDNRIGSDAAVLPVPDCFFSSASATCSLEHFEGDTDIRFMKEMRRVLRPGGKVVIVPLYLYPTACYVTDPIMSVPGEVPFDAPVLCIENWGNRHARFYSPETLKERLITHNPDMEFQILLLENPNDFSDPVHCYCRFIMIGIKK